VVVFTLKEGLLQEDHSGEHASKTPDIKRVVIGLQIDKKFWSFEVSGSNSHIVLLARVVILRESPVDKSQLSVLMINHDIMRLNVSVHDSLGVRIVESSQNFEDVEPDVEVSETLVESPEVNITRVHILHDERWSFCHRVSDHVQQIDDVHSVFESLENLDLPPDLGLLHRLQDLDHDPLVVQSVDSLVNFGVFASSDLLDDFVVLLGTAKESCSKLTRI